MLLMAYSGKFMKRTSPPPPPPRMIGLIDLKMYSCMGGGGPFVKIECFCIYFMHLMVSLAMFRKSQKVKRSV